MARVARGPRLSVLGEDRDARPTAENLARIGQLKREAPAQEEMAGLHRSAKARLADAEQAKLSLASRFDLAYNAAHALALYCLRRAGYRASARFTAFQTLPHTSSLTNAQWRVLARHMSAVISRSTKATWKSTISCWRAC